MQAAKALASLCICTDLPKPLLLDNEISTKISCASSFINLFQATMVQTEALIFAHTQWTFF